jgi:hypothetical protein
MPDRIIMVRSNPAECETGILPDPIASFQRLMHHAGFHQALTSTLTQLAFYAVDLPVPSHTAQNIEFEAWFGKRK